MIAHPTRRFPLLALDLESVLVPEIWQAVASSSDVDDLTITTRDEPDYERLMNQRIRVCKLHDLRLDRLRSIVATLKPFAEATRLLQEFRDKIPTVILSDTFYELAEPLMDALGHPLLLAHRIETDDEGFIRRVHLRQRDAKRTAVQAFQELGHWVIAVGDSHNDIGMLSQADAPFWLKPPVNLRQQYPRIPCLGSLDELTSFLKDLTRIYPSTVPL